MTPFQIVYQQQDCISCPEFVFQNRAFYHEPPIEQKMFQVQVFLIMYISKLTDLWTKYVQNIYIYTNTIYKY